MINKCISQQTCNIISNIITNRMYEINEEMKLLVKSHLTRQYSRPIVGLFDQEKIDELNVEMTHLDNALENLQKCGCSKK